MRRTFDERWIWGHTWTPDGEELVFASTRLGLFELWRVGVSEGVPEWVPVRGGESLIKPVISAASGDLFYEQWSYDANIWQLEFLSDHDTKGAVLASSPQPVVDSTQWDAAPQLSPDGKRLAFTSRRSGELEIWLANSDGSQPQQLTTEGSFASSLRWSPDGGRLAYSVRAGAQVDVWVTQVEKGAPRQITKNAANELHRGGPTTARPSTTRRTEPEPGRSSAPISVVEMCRR